MLCADMIALSVKNQKVLLLYEGLAFVPHMQILDQISPYYKPELIVRPHLPIQLQQVISWNLLVMEHLDRVNFYSLIFAAEIILDRLSDQG